MRIRYAGKDVKMLPFLQRFLGEYLLERMLLKIMKMPKAKCDKK